MAFTNSLLVIVDDPTKASDYNDLADNTEFNREKANVEHSFDISTGTGKHTFINPSSITMDGGDILLEGNDLWFDAAQDMTLISTGTKQLDLKTDALVSMRINAGSGADTSIMVRSPDSQDPYFIFSDTTSNRFALGYDDSAGVFAIAQGGTLATSNVWQFNANARVIHEAQADASSAAHSIKASQGGDFAKLLKLYNDTTAQADSGVRLDAAADTTTNGETVLGRFDWQMKNIGASTYRGELALALAGNGTLANRAVLRSGYGVASAVFEVRAPDDTPIGLVLANDTFSATDAAGLQFWVDDTGEGNIRPYAGSTHYDLNLEAAEFTFKINSNARMTLDNDRIRLQEFNNGSGAGRYLQLGRNTHGTTPAAGHIVFQNLNGATYYLWVDGSGDVRVHTAQPTNANDTAGTVVGTQT